MAELTKTYVTQEGIAKYDELIKAKMAADIKDAEDRAKAHAEDLDHLYEGAGAVQTLREEILTGETVNDFGAAEQAIADAKKAGTDAMAEANEKVASVAAGDASITVGGTATEPTVAVKLSQADGNALTLESDGLKVSIPEVVVPEYSVVKDSNSGDFAAVYHLTKDGTNIGAAINIPKDMVVSSGSVVTNPTGQPAGTYIELVLQNVDDPLYINVGNLIEYVTSGSQTTDMVEIHVSDDHKVTATVTDKSLTLAKMATDVTDAIADAKAAGTQASADLLAYQSTNDVAVSKKVETSVYNAYVESNDQAVADLGAAIEAFKPVEVSYIEGLFANA